jgi:peptidoglycan hydrolase-like protein with peptidoglycan-binding domain
MAFNSVAQAESWARAHPTKTVGAGGPSWDQWCGALMFWVGNFTTSADTATIAYRRSAVVSTNASAAPRGAFHWWRSGEGHVALDLDGGGSRLLMASRHVTTSFGTAIGTASKSSYTSTTGLPYLGWSLDFIGQKLSDVGQPGPGSDQGGGSVETPLTSAQATTLQNVARRLGGYTGPVDGVMGLNSWKGVQAAVRGYGYQGPIDGVPGIATWKGLQNLAKLGGYSGPVDGVPGPNTYAGLNAWLSASPGTPPTASQGVYGVDVGSSQANLDFYALSDAGYQFAIVKAGGSNVSPIYTAPYYTQQVARARDAGLVVGHYWLVGSASPAADADYFLSHLFDYRPGDLLALDNETIDNGTAWNDAQAAVFISEVKAALGIAPFVYMNGSLLASSTWSQTRALGSKLWIANPNGTPGNVSTGSFSEWAIHQYSWTGSQGDIDIDLNIAKLSAFAGFTQPQHGNTAPPPSALPGGTTGGGGAGVSVTVAQGKILQNFAAKGGYTGPIDGVMGTNSWRGVQQTLRDLGYYEGPADGAPGVNTYRGLQRLAKVYGYTGPIDGIPGTNTYNGIQSYLNSVNAGVPAVSVDNGKVLQRIGRAGGYTGTIDGIPGANTWKGVQQLLSGYGYAGPVDGALGTNSWKAFQRLAAMGGYVGGVDGVMGVNSWKGVQNLLQGFGYAGPVDGVPGVATYSALQRVARLGGYAGVVDGEMGINSWKGIQTVLSGSGYSGPVDGIPGANTYRALQSLARRGGYSGPVDGVPGANTYAGLSALLD